MTRHERLELLGCPWFAGVHRQKNTHISIPQPTEWSIRQIGIKKHPLTALLKYSPAVLKSSILGCWQALRLDLSRHVLLVVDVVRYTMRIKRTPSSSIQSILVFGSKKARAIISLISLLEQKSLRIFPFPLPNRLLTKSARGYTLYSQLMLQHSSRLKFLLSTKMGRVNNWSG